MVIYPKATTPPPVLQVAAAGHLHPIVGPRVCGETPRRQQMVDLTQISEHMEIIGADGVHIGTVDKIDGNRIKMTKADSGSHDDHHHYISQGLIAAVDGNQVRLSASGASALLFEEEEDGGALSDKNPD
jgi:hypothetical protein